MAFFSYIFIAVIILIIVLAALHTSRYTLNWYKVYNKIYRKLDVLSKPKIVNKNKTNKFMGFNIGQYSLKYGFSSNVYNDYQYSVYELLLMCPGGTLASFVLENFIVKKPGCGREESSIPIYVGTCTILPVHIEISDFILFFEEQNADKREEDLEFNVVLGQFRENGYFNKYENELQKWKFGYFYSQNQNDNVKKFITNNLELLKEIRKTDKYCTVVFKDNKVYVLDNENLFMRYAFLRQEFLTNHLCKLLDKNNKYTKLLSQLN